jgi:hypothetical protein
MMERQLHPALAAALVVLMLGRTALGQMAEAKTVKLKFQPGGRASSVYTPSKLLGHGARFHFGQDHGRIKAFGQEILVGGQYVGDGYLLGVDCDGDQKITGSEWVRLNLLTRAAKFLLRLGEGAGRREHALRFVNVHHGVQVNRVISLAGQYMTDGCMAGTLDNVPIGIFDDNLDGQYTQDGKDAIVIGASPGAMPLWKYHQVGEHHCLLSVAGDGGEITVQPIEHADLGAVDVPIRSSLVRCLMLEDDKQGRAYDVRESGRGGIPAGNYQLAYAVLGTGSRIVVAGPSAKSLVYTVAARSLNVLRFGPPCELVFGAYYHERDRQLRVRTNMVPYGVGGEQYYMALAGYHPLGENPHVVFTNGRTILTNGHMVYNSEDFLLEFAEWVPVGFTKKTGRIVVTCELPVLGKAVGVRTLEDILDGKNAEIPDPKRPAVATKKLPEGVVLGKAPPKPKAAPPPPPPPPPRPRPETRPVRPRVEDPEFDAATMLDVAKAFLSQEKRAMGIAKLKELLQKYPKTRAAKQAYEMLLDIEIAGEPK